MHTVWIILLLSQFLCIMGDEKDCLTVCPLVLKAVCGTVENVNGDTLECTFTNVCELEKFTCITNQELVKKDGPCDADSRGCYELPIEL
ncbi:hypothetical protein FF38_02044 [Lucilia cuprina]|uniref:Kazal-like domain-containing protein n=1 Tax=Lucilia cuprina TaxID=7375 RepID=A0A0L0BW81_LUCCU|nr:hypothetical protein CVS40_9979 [Lucilia cuprina]KNC24283.1 hypothetical protein FF38_02044 [Lucilia cuprina]